MLSAGKLEVVSSEWDGGERMRNEKCGMRNDPPGGGMRNVEFEMRNERLEMLKGSAE